MATHGTLDVVVHLHRFRNVDLFSRGIYMVRASIKCGNKQGIPHGCWTQPSTLSTFVRDQEIPCAHTNTLPAACVVNESSEFASRAFVIKYRGERLELNEGAQFQLLVEAVDDGISLVFADNAPLDITLELLMAELEKPNERAARSSAVAAEKPSATPTFARVAAQTLRVRRDPTTNQAHAYFPATFSSMHFCQLDVTVHCSLLHVKFRTRAYNRLETSVDSLVASFAELLDTSDAPATFERYTAPLLASYAATCAALKTPAEPLTQTRLVSSATLAAAIEGDNTRVAKQLFLAWGRFVALLPRDGAALNTALQGAWLGDQRAWWASRLASADVRIQTLLQPREPDEFRASFAALRAGVDKPPRVGDRTLLQDSAQLPAAAAHVYRRRGEDMPLLAPDAPIKAYDGPHLIVMQHGWYASSFDMRLLRAYALLLFPGCVVLSPQSNEDNSGGSMGPMGQRLAHEVHNFIKHRCAALGDKDPAVGRLSFVGHSAGSMIVRAALASPVLKPYLPKLHAFVSLSSSHCGNMFVPSTLISGGMWALQHLHRSQFMDELQLLDAAEPGSSFMHRLSTQPGFELFRFVVLVGSLQDAYVPLHTAQATIPRPAEVDRRGGGDAYRQMATNLLSPVMQQRADAPKRTTVVRLTLDHKFARTNLDTVIGRAAHLVYIDSPAAVLLILFSLYNVLR